MENQNQDGTLSSSCTCPIPHVYSSNCVVEKGLLADFARIDEGVKRSKNGMEATLKSLLKTYWNNVEMKEQIYDALHNSRQT